MTDANRRAARTVVQTLLAVAALLPVIVDGAGLSRSLPWVATALAVAGATSRIMSLAGVQALLPAWLRATGPADGSAKPDGRAAGGRG
ncbi:hypothetical protein ABTY20_04900 [Streptomyces sp. NPDC126497]|uniref:hypothetical protein n=1 Tax=Streptomyces sp. NPDC126497 TaxID=3155313 RepID=UPI003324070D